MAASVNVTRLPNGIVDASENGAYQNYKQLRPFRYYSWLNDFFDFIAADWTITDTGTGTHVVTGGAGGQLALTNAAAGATDALSVQWSGSSGATVDQFDWVSTKDFMLAASFSIDDITNASFIVGLASTDTTPIASLPTNGIFWSMVGAAHLFATIRIAGVSTSIDLGLMTAATLTNVVMFYNSIDGTWACYLADALVGTMTAASNTPTAALTPTMGLINVSSAVAHVLTVDYLQASVER